MIDTITPVSHVTYNGQQLPMYTPPVPEVQTETRTVSENGTYRPSSGKYFSEVTVDIPIVHYYTGSGAPAASLGSDGDIYLQI